MLSKITFSVILLSAVLVLTSFYGNDREEQGEVLSYTLIIENIKSSQEDLDLILYNVSGVKYSIETETTQRRRGKNFTELKHNYINTIEGQFQENDKEQIFKGELKTPKQAERLSLSQIRLKNNGKVVPKGDFKQRFKVKKIRLDITTTSQDARVELANIVAGKQLPKDKIKELVKTKQIDTEEGLDKILEQYSTDIKGTVIGSRQGDIIEINDTQNQVVINTLHPSPFTCIDENGVTFQIYSTESVESWLKKLKSFDFRRDKIKSSNVIFKLTRPIPEATSTEELTKPRTGNTDPIVPPDPTCDDGIQNGNETGTDCGGDCPSCELYIVKHDEKETAIEIIELRENSGEYTFDAFGDYECEGCEIFLYENPQNGTATPQGTQISYTLSGEWMKKVTNVDEKPIVKDRIAYYIQDSRGINVARGSKRIVVQREIDIKSNISIDTLTMTNVPPIYNYQVNDPTDMFLGYRIGDSIILNCEQNLLLVLAASFPLDTFQIRKLISQNTQDIAPDRKQEVRKMLDTYFSVDKINISETDDFTFNIFNTKEQQLAHRRGQSIKGNHPVHHFVKNQEHEKGYYAFAILNPEEICNGAEGVILYITFENNNLYTPIKKHIYTGGVKSETI